MTTPDSSLFDIVPQTEIVAAGGKRHKVRGVSFGVFLRIGGLWPSLLGLLGGKQIGQDEFASAPEAVAQFIAAGFGLANDEATIKWCEDLDLITQMDLFRGILKVTLGGGGRPFAQRISGISEMMQSGPSETESSGVSSGDSTPSQTPKAGSNSGPRQSPSSSATAIPQ